MFADGILIESVSIEDSNKIQAFEETLFCIHYPRQYSAARELEEFNEAQINNDTNQPLDSSITKKYLTALKVLFLFHFLFFFFSSFLLTNFLLERKR